MYKKKKIPGSHDGLFDRTLVDVNWLWEFGTIHDHKRRNSTKE